MIELAEVISELRVELDRARTAAEGSALWFGLGPVELEVTVALAREGTTDGKLKFWVAEASVGGKLSSTSTQRIKLTLHPTLGGEVQGAEQAASPVSVYVHGSAVPGEH